jgi:uncharacterized phage protein (TIGR02216 family)
VKEIDPGEKIPWSNFFRTSVLKFGVTPTEFWKMTPREWWVLFDALYGQDEAEAPITRADLEEMEKWVSDGRS